MNLRSTALAACSGILLAASFPNVNASLLAWIALVPLFAAVHGQDTKSAFWLGGLTGMIYFAGTVYWVTNAMYEYGGIPLVPACLAMLLLSSYLALYIALFAALVVRIKDRHPSLFFLVAPALWTALELARTYVISGFPWSLLGYSQYAMLPVIQVADITGVYGVSFVIVLVNAAIADVILDRKRFAAVIAALLLVVVIGYGYARLRRPASGESVTISVVQGNIDQDKKWDPAFQAATISTYRRLTDEAVVRHPDLVLWPETSVPFYFTGTGERDRVLTTDLIAFVKERHVPLLFGSATYRIEPNRHIVASNSAFLLSGDGHISAEYTKIHLVPFGEYVPLKNVLFFLEKLVQAVGDFQAGDVYTIMDLPYGAGGHKVTQFCTVICYEIIFPDLVRRFVDDGANIITTITNDAWFGRTAAPFQHFSMAVFRAVENRVPVARAANTGISGFIDAQGRILAASTIFTEAALTRAVHPGTEKTFYTRYGDIFAYACSLFTLIMLAMTRSRTTNPPPQ